MSADASTEVRTLRLIRGDATPEEVAAIVAVLAAAGGEPEDEARPRIRSAWSSPARHVRRSPAPGPGAWRASAFPHP